MENIAAAVDSVLGTIWPGEGAVNVREVGSGTRGAPLIRNRERTADHRRAGTAYALPLPSLWRKPMPCRY